jgi:hypothetical protein
MNKLKTCMDGLNFASFWLFEFKYIHQAHICSCKIFSVEIGRFLIQRISFTKYRKTYNTLEIY